ncbi:putative short chain dehydrogenase/ reductase [Teratosphaeria destructans]|uniref:Short chain dehydrogenase/ reductase n=1 Tax=Teratosphaeria destructans TaxID=418781 RepID=A0A9W7T136_9PEZI|nr:putative short chain dehydrogenase/ reductase [Teratosphaeria destructans]
MMKHLTGKTAFITGGAGGLGKSLAKHLASQGEIQPPRSFLWCLLWSGAHISLFSRQLGPLEEAREEILAYRRNESQNVNIVAVDMGYADRVDEAFKSQPHVPDIVYFVAGGNYRHNGFFVDLSAEDLEDCMRNNYFSAAYAAKSLMDIWLAEDATSRKPGFRGSGSSSLSTARRHYSGSQARVPTPVSCIFLFSARADRNCRSHAASKAAVRALADTLRLEVLRHNTADSNYAVHCAFPGDFISPGFLKEQETKVHLNKTIQGLHQPVEKLAAKLPSSDQVASMIMRAVDRGDFMITYSLEQHALFANMLGASPKRGWGVVDTLLQPLMSCFVMPYLRSRWEALARQDGTELRRSYVVR